MIRYSMTDKQQNDSTIQNDRIMHRIKDVQEYILNDRMTYRLKDRQGDRTIY